MKARASKARYSARGTKVQILHSPPFFRLSKMKIYQKYFSSFLLVVFLLIFFSGIVVLSLKNIYSSVSIISRENIPELRAIGECSSDIQEIKSNIRALFIEGGYLQRPQELEDLKKAVRAANSDLQLQVIACINAAKGGLNLKQEMREKDEAEGEEKELDLLSVFQKNADSFVAATNEAYALCEQNKFKEAIDTFEKIEKPLTKKLQDITEDLETKFYEDAAKKAAGVEKTVSSTITTTLLAGAGIILLTFGFGYIITSMITGPILKLKNAAVEISKGRLDIKVDVRSADEVGVLAAVFNKMAEALRELNKIKESLTGMIVHDLKTPLVVISESLEMVKLQLKEKLTGEVRSYLDMAHAAVVDLRRMTENLLDINKMEESGIKLNRENFALADIAKHVIDQMQFIAHSGQKVLSLALEGHVPFVSADKELMRRVIVNLIYNALKFTQPGGSVFLRIFYKSEEGKVYVQVKDTGVGIPKEYLEKVFDKFVQVEDRHVKTGYGLGLTFCKMVVEAHGGRIWAESEPGQGSLFTFVLPGA